MIVPSIIYRCVTRRRSQQLRCARPKTFQLDLVESGNSETQLRTEAKESATLVMVSAREHSESLKDLIESSLIANQTSSVLRGSV